MGYVVGQVIYVVLRKEASVFPLQIVEEIVKKTLEGEVVTYTVRMGADPTKTLTIEQVDGEIFDTAEKAKHTLLEKVSDVINRRIDHAIAQAKEWYSGGFEHAQDDPMSLIKKQPSAMPNVVPIARAKVAGAVAPEVASLAAEFAAEAAVGTMVEVAPGVSAKVRSITQSPTRQG